MINRGTLVCLLSVGFLIGLAGLSGAEACAQWRADGQYRFYQSNGAIVTFNLSQSGERLTGTATFNGQSGRVGGYLRGSYFRITVNWLGSPSLGVYETHLDPYGGTDAGSTWDQLKPNSGKARFSFGRFKCVVQ